jgi:hypothetical protein
VYRKKELSVLENLMCRHFMGLTLTAMVLTGYTTAVTVYDFVVNFNGDYTARLFPNISLTIVFVFSLWFFGSLVVLVVYHVKILAKGLTTNEDLKETYDTTPINQPFKKASTLTRKKTQPFERKEYIYKNVGYRDSGITYLGKGKMFEMENLESDRTNSQPLI